MVTYHTGDSWHYISVLISHMTQHQTHPYYHLIHMHTHTPTHTHTHSLALTRTHPHTHRTHIHTRSLLYSSIHAASVLAVVSIYMSYGRVVLGPQDELQGLLTSLPPCLAIMAALLAFLQPEFSLLEVSLFLCDSCPPNSSLLLFHPYL